MYMPHHRLAAGIRFLGILIIAAGLALCGTQIYALLHAHGRVEYIDLVIRAGVCLLLGIGLGSALMALGTIVGTKVDPTGAFLGSLQHLQSQVDQLSMRIGALSANIENDRRAAMNPPEFENDSLARIEEMLREVRELSLLGDADRRVRLSHHLEQRKRIMARQIMDLINSHEFARAEKILIDLEGQFPNDAYAQGCRRDLEGARRETETKLVRIGREKIEHLMAIGSWDQALAAVNKLVEDFPKNTESRELLKRVAHERETLIDANAQSSYEEIRRLIDQRQWRPALTGVQKLLAKYPMHHRAQQMRQQLRTIQENADIEERQEAEVQIQEMIRAGQFRDAIDLAEDITRRFPGSPQAEAIEELLPRLQELAGEPQNVVA
jgi:hypothetical protein